MARVAGGPSLVVDNPAPRARVLEPEPAPEPAPPALAVVEAAAPAIATLEDLLAEAERRRAIRFKLMVRNNLAPVSFVPPAGETAGRIEFVPTGRAPKDMARQIAERLREWTGAVWEVVARAQGGGDTLEERAEAERAEAFSSAEEDPVVQAVLATFPDAKIVDVTIRGGEEPVEETAAAAAEGLDGADAREGPDGTIGAAFDGDDPGATGLDDYFRD